jgi:peptide/nickel transport system substrate-binding protein
MRPRRAWRIVATVMGVGALLAGCATVPGTPASTATTVVVGTTERPVTLDPAGSTDRGSLAVRAQLYSSLLTPGSGTATPSPDVASAARFTSPTDYTVTLKPGLTFANGHRLTSSDVKFSFDRQLTIADPAGPSRLLADLQRVDAPSPQTVVFHLKVPNDPLFPRVLGSSAGAIVDEQVFSPTAITPDAAIVAAQGFDGQYTVDSFAAGRLITYVANPRYAGVLGRARSPIAQKFYTDPTNLKLDLEQGVIDVAAGGLSASDVAVLRSDAGIKLVTAPGGEVRSLVFNPATQPYGSGQPGADPRRALAVRVAVADLVDRAAIAAEGSKQTATPIFSVIPDGFSGAVAVLKTASGARSSGPDADKAKAALAAAGVPTPVALTISYRADVAGSTSTDEFVLLKTQLESTGLFAVKLQASPSSGSAVVGTSAVTSAPTSPVSELVWSPAYADADQYLTPLVRSQLLSGASDQAVVDEIASQAVEPDPARRRALLADIQMKLASDLTILPIVQGLRIVATGGGITGVALAGVGPLSFAGLVKR